VAIERKYLSGTAGFIFTAGPEDLPTEVAPPRDALEHRVFRGTVGQIWWQRYQAAEVQGYTVVPSGARWSLSCQLVARDPFKMSMRPLAFVAPLVKPRDLGGGIYGTKTEWRWPIETLEIAEGGWMTATLGALEP
jgi:hypothetical protein